jgi:hypothetical protein
MPKFAVQKFGDTSAVVLHPNVLVGPNLIMKDLRFLFCTAVFAEILEQIKCLSNRPEVVIKIYIFCDITQCSPLKFNRHFGGTCSSTYF